MSDKKRILAIFPHPDDAAFVAAGTLSRWAEEGHEIDAVCCTSGEAGTLDLNVTRESFASQREAELLAANAIMGIRQTEFLRYPDGGVLDLVALRKDLFKAIRQYRPDVVLSLDPWARYEVHPDHSNISRMAAEASTFACFHLLYPEHLEAGLQPHNPSEFWMMGMLGHAPNRFVDISSTLDKKAEAVLKFEATLGTINKLCSDGKLPKDADPAEQAAQFIRNIAAETGAHVGLDAAEAFYVQESLPGHFANMNECYAEMLGAAPQKPIIV